MTAHDCDTFAASTMAAPAEGGFAWSDCDDPHYQECAVDLYDDEAGEATSRWKWALVIVAWAVGALAVAVVVGMAYVALAPQQQPSPAQQQEQPMTTWISPNAGTIVPFPPSEPPQNT